MTKEQAQAVAVEVMQAFDQSIDKYIKARSTTMKEHRDYAVLIGKLLIETGSIWLGNVGLGLAHEQTDPGLRMYLNYLKHLSSEESI